MEAPARIGVIGCGAIAHRLHLPDYQVSSDALVTAVCDVDTDRARAAADRFAPDATVFGDYRALLDSGLCDGVSICLPNALHCDTTIAALEAGLHVMVEKPMAASLEEADRMIAAAKAADRLLLVNQTQRRQTVHRKAKEVIDSGILGRIVFVQATFSHGGPIAWGAMSDWFFSKEKARFGAMADLGVHKADLIRYLTGKEVRTVSGAFGTINNPQGDVDDCFASTLQFDDGTIGTLAATWIAYGRGTDHVYLQGEKGTLRVNMDLDRRCVAMLQEPACTIDFELPAPLNDYPDTWGVDVGGAFARAILGTEAPFCTGEQGRKALAIILAAEEAGLSGKTVRVDGA